MTCRGLVQNIARALFLAKTVEGGWSGDLYVPDSRQLAAAESIYQIYVRRIKAEEVFSQEDANDDFKFPCATGEVL